MAENDDVFALRRAAALNGMTLEAWLAHCDAVESAEKRRRAIDRTMRSVPKYRDAA